MCKTKDMDFLIERGYEERLEEMMKLHVSLHEKASDGGGLNDEQEGMFDLLQWLYHDEDKPVVQ